MKIAATGLVLLIPFQPVETRVGTANVILAFVFFLAMIGIKRTHTYIFSELVPPFVISLFFLTFVFLMTRIPEITNMVVNYNTNVADILMMIGLVEQADALRVELHQG